MKFNNDLSGFASELSSKVAKTTQDKILEQLGEFIKRGLLVVKNGPSQFIQDPYMPPGEIRFVQSIELELRDKVYIERLEKENAEMRGILSKLAMYYAYPVEAPKP